MEVLPPRHSCLEPWQVCWQEATGSHAPGWEWLPSLPVHPPRHSFSQIVQCIVSGKSQRAGQEPTYILVISLHPDHRRSPLTPHLDFPRKGARKPFTAGTSEQGSIEGNEVLRRTNFKNFVGGTGWSSTLHVIAVSPKLGAG